MEKAIIDFTKFTNFLYIYIATIIVGSILGMDREVLIKGFLKIFAPLAVGSVAAGLVGTLVGTLLGIGAYKTFFFIVVPIMAGGVGEGAIPLSIGYAAILGTQQGVMFAQVLPPVMLGSLTAIVLSGTLNYVGKKKPHLTGNGKLQPDAEEFKSSDAQAKSEAAQKGIDPATIGAAGLTAITLYLLGVMCHHLTGLPAPVAMLFLAVFAKLASAVSPRLQAGGFVVYKFVQVSMTYPLLFAIGVALTPWKDLMAAFTLVNLITIIATVGTLMTVGFFVGRAMNMYPIETAIVNACHSGQGGTGDVAILTAADRMALMPFAQIATRIGGALTVTGTLIVMKWIGADDAGRRSGAASGDAALDLLLVADHAGIALELGGEVDGGLKRGGRDPVLREGGEEQPHHVAHAGIVDGALVVVVVAPRIHVAGDDVVGGKYTARGSLRATTSPAATRRTDLE